jgi:DNA-binding PadR family transcriptional regulator
MSLRYGLLDLLAGEPMSGYDLARYFSASMGNVWPAQHSQIYPELAKLLAEGLIEQTGEGQRGRRIYQTTPKGIEALRSWLRGTEPDYSVRHAAQLRVFCLWVLPTDEALAHLARDRAEYVRHLAQIERTIATKDFAVSPTQRASRLTIEFGRRFYAAQIDWIDWATEQIAAGTLQEGGPVPTGPGSARSDAHKLSPPHFRPGKITHERAPLQRDQQ